MHKTAWFFSTLAIVLVVGAASLRGDVSLVTLTQEFSDESMQTAQVNSMGIDMSNATASDKGILNGGCDTDPFQALAKYGCTRQNECVPSGPNGQGGINSGLACRLSKLFDAAARSGCSPRINSAYRSAAKQASMCGGGRSGCAPARKSCHQYGLAVDVNCVDVLKRLAGQYQLHFPYWGPHIQCIEHRQAACSPSTPPCKGGGPISDPGQGGQQPPGGGQQPPGGQDQQGSPQTGQQPSGGGQPGAGSGEQGMPPEMKQQDPFQKKPEESAITDPGAEGDITLTCDPESVTKGESVNIEWECPAGTRSVGSSSNSFAPLNTKGEASGSSVVKPQQKTRYTVQCKKGAVVVGKQSCEIQVAKPTAKLSVRFSVEPQEVYPGETVEVVWSSQNARSCTVTGPGVASSDKSGRVSSASIDNEETFTIKCKAKTGTDVFTKTETVTLIEEDVLYDEAKQKNNTGQTNQVQTIFEDPLDEI